MAYRRPEAKVYIFDGYAGISFEYCSLRKCLVENRIRTFIANLVCITTFAIFLGTLYVEKHLDTLNQRAVENLANADPPVIPTSLQDLFANGNVLRYISSFLLGLHVLCVGLLFAPFTIRFHLFMFILLMAVQLFLLAGEFSVIYIVANTDISTWADSDTLKAVHRYDTLAPSMLLISTAFFVVTLAIELYDSKEARIVPCRLNISRLSKVATSGTQNAQLDRDIEVGQRRLENPPGLSV